MLQSGVAGCRLPSDYSDRMAKMRVRLKQQELSSRAILSSEVWRRWLLDGRRVDELMHRLAGLGIVYYSVAGSSLRIDWRVDTLPEVVRAAL
jgi:hypothetical protein